MPCSLCGGIGHNRRTCNTIIEENVQGNLQENVPENIEDPIITLLISEQFIRNSLINNSITTIGKEKINFFESLLSIKYKEFRIINLDNEISYDIYISNDNSNVFQTDIKEYTYIGTIFPRSLDKIVSFTGYKYLFTFNDEHRVNNENISEKNIINYAELIIDDNIKDTYILNEIKEIETNKRFPVYPSFKLNEKNQTLISALKMNYLLNEMKRLGGLEDDNYGCILDMHEDIVIPEHNDLDLEAAGLPNKLFTNIT